MASNIETIMLKSKHISQSNRMASLSEIRINSLLQKAIINIVCMLLILSCNTLYSIQGENNSLFTLLLFVGITVYITYRWITIPIQKAAWSHYCMWVLFVLLIFAAISIFHHQFDFSATSQGVFFILFPLFFYFLYKEDLLDYFYTTFNRFIIFLSITSTILWLVGPTLNLMEPNCSIYNPWVVSRAREVPGWCYLLFNAADSVTVLNDIRIFRNCSIFVEPAIYSYVIAIALILESFLLDRDNKKLIIGILLVTTITTTSATGISTAILILIARAAVSSVKNGRIELKWSLSLIPVAILIIRGALSMRFAAGSGGIRMDNLYAEMAAWSYNILFGNGFGNRDLVIANMSDWRMHDIGASDSIGLVFVYGGLVYFSVFCVALAGFFKDSSNLKDSINNSNFKCAGLIHFIIWSLTVVLFKPISVMFWSIGVFNHLRYADIRVAE